MFSAVPLTRLVPRLAILTVIVGLVYALGGWFAASKHGVVAWGVVGAAAGICWLSAAVAISLVFFVSRPEDMPNAVLAGFALNSLPPLAAGFALHRLGGVWSEVGVFGWMVAFFLVCLVVKTALVLTVLPKSTPSSSHR